MKAEEEGSRKGAKDAKEEEQDHVLLFSSSLASFAPLREPSFFLPERAAFHDVLQQVVGRVDELPDQQRERWEQLLWFAHALVYHSREGSERDALAEYIRATVREARKTETATMRQTIAELIKSEGRLEGKTEGKQEALLRVLRRKFDAIPTGVEERIRHTSDEDQLNGWLDEAATARKWSDLSFVAQG